MHAIAILGYLPKLRRGLGLAFGAHFLHEFSIKMLLISYSIIGQSLNVISFFLLKVSNKICYEVLIWTVDDVINLKIYLQSKRGEDGNTKI